VQGAGLVELVAGSAMDGQRAAAVREGVVGMAEGEFDVGEYALRPTLDQPVPALPGEREGAPGMIGGLVSKARAVPGDGEADESDHLATPVPRSRVRL
jgi:hypothetical protein